MSVRRLIEFFSMFTKLPVQIEDVVGQMLEMGIQDDIRLIAMDVPPEKLLGMLVRYKEKRLTYSGKREVALIIYNENVDEKMQRLICCKELMSLFEVDDICTNSKEELLILVEELTNVSVSTSLLTVSIQTSMDTIALYMALAVLFPHEIRDEWIKAHNSAKVSIADISTEFAIPIEYVPMLLTKAWDTMRGILLRIGSKN